MRMRGSRRRWMNSLRAMARMRVSAAFIGSLTSSTATPSCVALRGVRLGEVREDRLHVARARRGRRRRRCRAPTSVAASSAASGPSSPDSTRTTSPNRWGEETPSTCSSSASAARGSSATTSNSRPGYERLHLGGRPAMADSAALHERDVGAALGLVHVGRGHEHRLALAVQPRDDPPELAAADRVHAGRRLVEQQQVGLVHQRGREHELLLHASREVLRLAVGELGEAHALEQRLRALAPHVGGHGADGREELEVLGDGEVGIHREPLGHVADARRHLPRCRGHRLAEDERVAGVGREHRREHPDERRLAGAVGAEQPEDRRRVGPRGRRRRPRARRETSA